ncbi:MAG: nucleotidyltransferase domain-containing protein [Chitinophagales bacterium]|nr:nucleotidyltransferase domain-containing protein [Chitinophagales bacterium]
MLTQSQIQNIVDTIVKGYKPEKVILFGSYANGNASKEIDLDFVIIKKTDTRFIERAREIHGLFHPYPWAMDIFVFTPKEFKKRKKIYGTLEYIVDKEGKTVYAN